ncbi:hypothetical protein SPI02_03620 [Staphylococcus piscifermentans]|uniref:Uncharacterized protein n=1 Tax=Staphylococcus piscifermentans TaxID=70258 RepID=A0A512QJZ6_9STAP|nr:hypothetical protein SPI02_03620 [Staphylococcus piscifermentans]
MKSSVCDYRPDQLDTTILKNLIIYILNPIWKFKPLSRTYVRFDYNYSAKELQGLIAILI